MSISDLSIVSGGWSVADVDLSKLVGFVIAVNDSGVLVPRCDAIVSMDRLWTEHRWSKLFEMGRSTWLRRSAIQNIPPIDRTMATWLNVFECDHESSVFSDDPTRLNGTNSGACALNLAYLLKPRRLFLLGFDMNRSPKGRPYWYEPYPWANQNGGTGNKRYKEWASQFEQAAASFRSVGTEVFNVSPRSAIDVFQKITPKKYAEEFSA
jgi:hypothetical protein